MADIYAVLYDLKERDFKAGEFKDRKKGIEEMNDCLRKTITNSRYLADSIYEIEEVEERVSYL